LSSLIFAFDAVTVLACGGQRDGVRERRRRRHCEQADRDRAGDEQRRAPQDEVHVYFHENVTVRSATGVPWAG